MWQQTTRDDPQWTRLEFWPAVFERCRLIIEGDTAISRTIYPSYQRLEREEQELRALLQTWRDRGETDLAQAVEEFSDDWGSIWDQFEKKTGEEKVEELRIDLNDPRIKFYKLMDSNGDWLYAAGASEFAMTAGTASWIVMPNGDMGGTISVYAERKTS